MILRSLGRAKLESLQELLGNAVIPKSSPTTSTRRRSPLSSPKPKLTFLFPLKVWDCEGWRTKRGSSFYLRLWGPASGPASLSGHRRHPPDRYGGDSFPRFPLTQLIKTEGDCSSAPSDRRARPRSRPFQLAKNNNTPSHVLPAGSFP